MPTAWGNYKVAPTDFIEHMMAIYKQFMLSFATIYEQDELGGDNWLDGRHLEGQSQENGCWRYTSS
jgi:hypothetical protein